MEDEKICVTVRGIDIEVNPENLNDLDVLDWLDEVNEGRILKLKKLLKRMLGDSWEKVYESMRGENGIVKSSDASAFLLEFLSATEEKK